MLYLTNDNVSFFTVQYVQYVGFLVLTIEYVKLVWSETRSLGLNACELQKNVNKNKRARG